MANTLKNTLKLETLKLLKEEISSGNHYLFLASSEPELGVIQDTIKETNDGLRELISAFKILPADVEFCIALNPWVQNTVYDTYDDSQNLKLKNYYVTVEDVAYGHVDIFICIDNNSGAVSIDSPYTATGEDKDFIISPNDKYIWKHMYRLTSWRTDKFTTDTHIKIVQNETSYSNAYDGSIEKIKITKIGGIFPNAVNINLDENFTIVGAVSNTKQLTLSTDTAQTNIAKDAGVNAIYNDNYMIYLFDAATNQYHSSYTIDQYNYNAGQITITTCEAFNGNAVLNKIYKILPKINIVGNGSGLVIMPMVDPTSLKIEAVDVINPGTGYSYVKLTSINGYEYRAIYSLEGGIGYDILRDLNCSELMIQKEVNPTAKPIYDAEPEVNTLSSQDSSLLSGSRFNPTQVIMPAIEDNQIYRFGLIVNSNLANSQFVNPDLISVNGCAIVTTWKGSDSQDPTPLPYNIDNFNINDLICQTDANGTILAYGKVISVKYFSYPPEDVPVLTDAQYNEVVLKCARPKLIVKMYKGNFLSTNGTLKKYDINNSTTENTTWKVYGTVISDVTKNKGTPVYIENTDPITLSSDSSANFKLIISV